MIAQLREIIRNNIANRQSVASLLEDLQTWDARGQAHQPDIRVRMQRQVLQEYALVPREVVPVAQSGSPAFSGYQTFGSPGSSPISPFGSPLAGLQTSGNVLPQFSFGSSFASFPAAVPQTSGSIPQFSTSGSTFSGSSLPPPKTYQQTPLVPPQFTGFQGPATRSAPMGSFGEQYAMPLSPPQDQFGNFQPLFSSTGSPPQATPFAGYATPSRTSPDADVSAQRRTLLSSWAPPTFKK
jgi:hypothetical protein